MGGKKCYVLFPGLFLEAGIKEIGIKEIGTKEIGTKEIGTKEIGMIEIDQGAEARKGV